MTAIPYQTQCVAPDLMPDGKGAWLRLTSIAEWLDPAEASRNEWLVGDELARYERINHEGRRHQYLAGHYSLRVLAAEFTASEPSEWSLLRSSKGAPIFHRAGHGSLFVSISHSGTHLAVSISTSPIGVDVERHRQPTRMEAIAARIFGKYEYAQFVALAEPGKTAFFLRQWTLREAFGKMDGIGLRLNAAGQQRFQPCGSEQALTHTWQNDALALAVAGASRSELYVRGIPADAVTCSWEPQSQNADRLGLHGRPQA